MKPHRKILAIAVAAAFPWVGAQAQSNADLLREINQLKAQLKMLQDKVEAQASQPAAAPAIDPVEFNRLVLKVDQAEEDKANSGLKGIKFKGTIEAQYYADKNGTANAFTAGNGYAGAGMLEISKETDGGDGISWTLRMTPGGGTSKSGSMLHEASISVPLDKTARIIGGQIPDWEGYESTFANQNLLVTHGLLFNNAAASSYSGLGLSYTLSSALAFKWMVANIDEQTSRKSPGFAYRADWTINEFASLGLAGVSSRATRNFDLIDIDGGYVRGDWTFNGQISYGREKQTATGGAFNGGDASWWGLSALAAFKVTPRLQTIARVDFINNRKNGGGIYYVSENPLNTAPGGTLNALTSGFGPELDQFGVAADPTRGANRTAVSIGTNYAINPSTQWKTELRFDRASGYNFTYPNNDGSNYRKTNTGLGTSVVVSF